MRVLVLGGTGFIGRHAALALAARGHQVAIGTRDPRRALRRLPPRLRGCELVEVHHERLKRRRDWHVLLAGFHCVINAVGILRRRGAETYQRVHHLAPAALAAACALAPRRLVHISALGLSDAARSGFLRSKLAGERALAAGGADYSIVRPSLLDGEGGYGARWLRALARLPVHLYPADAHGRIAVMDVRDLGSAIVRLCELPSLESWREVELGGSTVLTIAQHLAALRARRGSRPALQLAVPAWLARLASHACDLAHFSPFSYGHLELMRRDNIPRVNRLPELLGRPLGPGEIVEPAPVALGGTALEGGGRLGAPAA